MLDLGNDTENAFKGTTLHSKPSLDGQNVRRVATFKAKVPLMEKDENVMNANENASSARPRKRPKYMTLVDAEDEELVSSIAHSDDEKFDLSGDDDDLEDLHFGKMGSLAEVGYSLRSPRSDEARVNLRRSERTRGKHLNYSAATTPIDTFSEDYSSEQSTTPKTPAITSKYSISKLLKEKESKQKRLNTLYASKVSSSDHSAHESDDDSVLSSEHKGHLFDVLTEEMHDLQQSTIVIFTDIPRSLPTPQLQNALYAPPADDYSFYEHIIESSKTTNGVRQLLQSRLLSYRMKQGWLCPMNVFDWLVEIAVFSTDRLMSAMALDVKLHLVLACERFVGMLRLLGMGHAFVDCAKDIASMQNTTHRSATLPSINIRAHLSILLDIQCNCLSTHPTSYTLNDVRLLLLILARIALDTNMQSIEARLRRTVTSAMMPIPQSELDAFILDFSQALTQSCSSPQLLAHMLHLFSSAYQPTLHFRSQVAAHVFESFNQDYKQKLNLANAPLLDRICQLVSPHNPNFKVQGNQTDYERMAALIRLCDLSLAKAAATEPVLSLEKALRHIHGRILDPRGAFLNRTMAKDVIQRLQMRLYLTAVLFLEKQAVAGSFHSPSGFDSMSLQLPSSASVTSASTSGSSNSGKSNQNTFVHKLYNMVVDKQYQHLIAWNYTGTSFIVCNITEFSREVLPKHFKHNNFSSFVRQLNMYGFHKVNKSPRGHRTLAENQIWEFSHARFLRGRPDLLDDIKRKAMESENLRRETGDLHQHIGMMQVAQSDMMQQLAHLQGNFTEVCRELAETKRKQNVQQQMMKTVMDYLANAPHGNQQPFQIPPELQFEQYDIKQDQPIDRPPIYITSPDAASAQNMFQNFYMSNLHPGIAGSTEQPSDTSRHNSPHPHNHATLPYAHRTHSMTIQPGNLAPIPSNGMRNHQTLSMPNLYAAASGQNPLSPTYPNAQGLHTPLPASPHMHGSDLGEEASLYSPDNGEYPHLESEH